MSELEDFLAHTLQRHAQATTRVRNGDATSRIETLSTRDPVTLFPASQPAWWQSRRGAPPRGDAQPQRGRRTDLTA
jgi:hypothetical protein